MDSCGCKMSTDGVCQDELTLQQQNMIAAEIGQTVVADCWSSKIHINSSGYPAELHGHDKSIFSAGTIGAR